MEEVWKQIKGYSSYEVSNLGKVRRENLILKPEIMDKGYYRVKLYNVFGDKKIMVHQLVYDTFIGEDREYGIEIDHKDNIKSNNRADNLQLLTCRKNNIKSSTRLRSKFPGVSMMVDGRLKKWQARLRRIHLGYYFTESEAALAYQKMLISKGEF